MDRAKAMRYLRRLAAEARRRANPPRMVSLYLDNLEWCLEACAVVHEIGVESVADSSEPDRLTSAIGECHDELVPLLGGSVRLLNRDGGTIQVLPGTDEGPS